MAQNDEAVFHLLRDFDRLRVAMREIRGIAERGEGAPHTALEEIRRLADETLKVADR